MIVIWVDLHEHLINYLEFRQSHKSWCKVYGKLKLVSQAWKILASHSLGLDPVKVENFCLLAFPVFQSEFVVSKMDNLTSR